MNIHEPYLVVVVVVVEVVGTVLVEDAPVVLGVDEPPAQGLGRGAVLGVPCGVEGPGLGVPGREGERVTYDQCRCSLHTLLLVEESREWVVLHLLLDLKQKTNNIHT